MLFIVDVAVALAQGKPTKQTISTIYAQTQWELVVVWDMYNGESKRFSHSMRCCMLLLFCLLSWENGDTLMRRFSRITTAYGRWKSFYVCSRSVAGKPWDFKYTENGRINNCVIYCVVETRNSRIKKFSVLQYHYYHH